jgi:ribosomal protein S12 methylthiotransferase accessory factor
MADLTPPSMTPPSKTRGTGAGPAFRRMYGNPRMDAVLGSVDGSLRFFGLTPTSMKLEGLDRHHRLIDRCKKLHKARASAGA